MIINNSTVVPLNEKDKEVLQSLVNAGIHLAKKLSITMIVIFAVSLLLFASNGIVAGCAITAGMIFLTYLIVFNSYYIIYLELKSNTKTRYVLTQYEIISNKKGVFLTTKEPKMKLNLDEDLLSLLNSNQPIIVEITKRSKTLLFLSHNDNNLLD